MLITKQTENNDEKMIDNNSDKRFKVPVKEKWIGGITTVVEVFGYLVVQLTLAGLLVYELIGYVMYKLN